MSKRLTGVLEVENLSATGWVGLGWVGWAVLLERLLTSAGSARLCMVTWVWCGRSVPPSAESPALSLSGLRYWMTHHASDDRLFGFQTRQLIVALALDNSEFTTSVTTAGFTYKSLIYCSFFFFSFFHIFILFHTLYSLYLPKILVIQPCLKLLFP